MLGSCFLYPGELSSCQHDWLKINSSFKCDSLPQTFHKCKPDRFEEERELFYHSLGVLLFIAGGGKKKTVENPEECSPVVNLPPAVSLRPHPTASLRSAGGARSTLLSSWEACFTLHLWMQVAVISWRHPGPRYSGPFRSVKTWAPPPLYPEGAEEHWPHSHNSKGSPSLNLHPWALCLL